MSPERSVPNSIPRQKAYTYLLLIGITSILIYFYSYPLTMEHWTFIKEKVINNVGLGLNEMTNASDIQTYRTRSESTAILKTIFFKDNSTVQNTSTIKPSVPRGVSNNLPENSSTRNMTHTKNNLMTNASDIETYRTRSESTAILKTIFFKDNITVQNIYTTETSVPRGASNNLPENSSTGNMTHTKNKLSTIPVTHGDNSQEQFSETSIQETSETKNVFQITSTVNSEYASIPSAEIPALHTAETEKNVAEKTVADEVMQKINEIPSDSTKMGRILPDAENSTQGVAANFEDTAIKETKDLAESEHGRDMSTEIANLENATSSVQKGYLVFSENCKIPDIDPWHPSILKYIDTSPPLNCSEDYQPLSRTDGNLLLLDVKGILERTAGQNYTCCYRSIFRKYDGKTDDSFGSSKCISISHETIMKDEFIQVTCKYQNGTKFYREFHSFIFDKPKVEERCSNASNSLYSVLIIGADSVSRLNMHRQLNATTSYLLNEMDAVEMYGYNKVGDNTFPNLVPLLTGYDETELLATCWKSHKLPLDNCNILWKTFAEKGYRTFYAEDAPHISTFNYVKEGFHRQPTDYYFRPFILAYENLLGRDKPLNCYHCVGSTSETEAVLNWAKQLALHFSDRPYFAFSWINSLTHDFLNLGSAGDYMYENFFRQLHQSGALNKTIVVLISDHGMRWGGIRNTYVGRLEERLPMLLIALPEKFKQEHPNFANALRDNSHRLVTPYDLHATLRHLLNLTENWTFTNTDGVDEELSYNFTTRAQSLFQPVPKDRSCDDAYIAEHWCTCETSLDADVEDEEVKLVATFLVKRVNNLLEPSSDKCAVLTLDTILDARIWQPPVEHVGHSVNDDIYTVVIQTNPSKAVFEGTVKVSKPQMRYSLLGAISRLNLYGNQSSCVHDAILKKYCYCL